MATASMGNVVLHRTPVYDCRRWEHFEPRSGDIFVCTPAKCGTTWMQTIAANLIFPAGDLPMPVMMLSPWIEFVLIPEQEMYAALAAQDHRRVMKSHSPADGVPWLDDARYIVVARKGLDAFMSFCNHVERFKILPIVNEKAVNDGLEPLAEFDGNPRAFFPEWLNIDTPPRILSGFWKKRHQPNVLLVHYDDMKRDLESQMRRVASFLEIEVDDALWPGCVERCSFEYMREHPEMVGDFEMMFEGGTRGFIYKGTNGRWRGVLTEAEVAAYRRHAEEHLPPDALAWLEGDDRS